MGVTEHPNILFYDIYFPECPRGRSALCRWNPCRIPALSALLWDLPGENNPRGTFLPGEGFVPRAGQDSFHGCSSGGLKEFDACA